MSIILNPAEDDSFMTFSAQVVTGAMKYILPVPTDKGEPLVYPKIVTDTKGVVHKKGDPIMAHGEPMQGDGVAVYNSSEQIYQAGVRGKTGDERAVLIVNHATKEQAGFLNCMLNRLTLVEDEGFSDPETLTFDNFKKLERYARSLGLTNMYDSTVGRIHETMVPVGNEYGTATYGHMKRKDTQICYAVRAPEAGELILANGESLPFAAGSIIVRQGEHYGAVTPKDFKRDYRFAVGDENMDLSQISTFAVPQKPGRAVAESARLAAN